MTLIKCHSLSFQLSFIPKQREIPFFIQNFLITDNNDNATTTATVTPINKQCKKRQRFIVFIRLHCGQGLALEARVHTSMVVCELVLKEKERVVKEGGRHSGGNSHLRTAANSPPRV